MWRNLKKKAPIETLNGQELIIKRNNLHNFDRAILPFRWSNREEIWCFMNEILWSWSFESFRKDFATRLWLLIACYLLFFLSTRLMWCFFTESLFHLVLFFLLKEHNTQTHTHIHTQIIVRTRSDFDQPIKPIPLWRKQAFLLSKGEEKKMFNFLIVNIHR